MANILDLPTEILDIIFDYLLLEDRKVAKLVCHQWNHQLSALRYWKSLKLCVTPKFLLEYPFRDILKIISQNKHQCVEVYSFCDFKPYESRNSMRLLLQLLQASHFSLRDLSFEHCSELSMSTTFDVLGNTKITRTTLRHLRVILNFGISGVCSTRIPRVSIVSGALAFVTNLEVSLVNSSCVELVSSFSKQLTHLKLLVYKQDLLIHCLNEIQFPVLQSLSMSTADTAVIDLVQPSDLGDKCWRTLERLETLRISDGTLLYMVLAEMLQHCRNLTYLAIEQCNISFQCIHKINTLVGLKNLQLNVFRCIGSTGRSTPTLNLPNLEHLHLSTELDVRLGKLLPQAISFMVENPAQSFCPKSILSEVKRIVQTDGRILRRLVLKQVNLDREACTCLNALLIDVLSFENCNIDGYFLQLLEQQQPRRKIRRILMDDCAIAFDDVSHYPVRTVHELRWKNPCIEIAVIRQRLNRKW